MRLLLIDNFDSFVYNLAQEFGANGCDPVVVRNEASLEDLRALNPDAVVVSPGPGKPDDAGVSNEAITYFGGNNVPVLGVCLGHQCIGTVYGADVDRAPVGPRHGKTSPIAHDERGVFQGLSSPFEATRYHSLAIRDETVPDELEVSARSDDGVIMGVRHRSLPVEGVQFHPESIVCAEGPRLLANFVRRVATTN